MDVETDNGCGNKHGDKTLPGVTNLGRKQRELMAQQVPWEVSAKHGGQRSLQGGLHSGGDPCEWEGAEDGTFWGKNIPGREKSRSQGLDMGLNPA